MNNETKPNLERRTPCNWCHIVTEAGDEGGPLYILGELETHVQEKHQDLLQRRKEFSEMIDERREAPLRAERAKIVEEIKAWHERQATRTDRLTRCSLTTCTCLEIIDGDLGAPFARTNPN